MASDSNKAKNENRQKEKKKPKGCYWNWLVDAEIKTYEAWNSSSKD